MIEPVRIEPGVVYDDGALHMTLGLTAAALAAGRRSGRLRSVKKGNRVFYLRVDSLLVGIRCHPRHAPPTPRASPRPAPPMPPRKPTRTRRQGQAAPLTP